MQKNSFCEGGTFHQFIPNSKSNSHCHLIVTYFELHPRGKTSTTRLTPPKPTMKPENLDLKKEKSSPKPSNHPYHPFFRLPQNLKNFQGYKLTPPPPKPSRKFHMRISETFHAVRCDGQGNGCQEPRRKLWSGAPQTSVLERFLTNEWTNHEG